MIVGFDWNRNCYLARENILHSKRITSIFLIRVRYPLCSNCLIHNPYLPVQCAILRVVRLCYRHIKELYREKKTLFSAFPSIFGSFYSHNQQYRKGMLISYWAHPIVWLIDRREHNHHMFSMWYIIIVCTCE